jgi:hypothetical protein
VRAERLRETLLPALGILILTTGGAAIGWVYAKQPQSLAEVGTGVQVAAGVYRVDEARFAAALGLFRREQFAAARGEWALADPAERDARTQFYVAYAFYREGWGRFHHDDALYRQGLVVAERAQALTAAAPWATDDADLKIKSPAELKAELDRGLTTTWDDFNPLRVMEERK